MWIAELFTAVTEAVVPPLDADPKAIYIHRLRTAATACFSALGLIASWAYFTKMVMPQLAKETEIETIEKTSNGRWGYYYRNSVIQLEQEKCTLPERSPLRLEIDRQIDDGLALYFRATGDPNFHDKSCSDQ